MFYPFLEGDGQLYVNFSQPSFMNILVPVLQHFLDTLLSVDRYISRYLVCLMSDLVGLMCDDGKGVHVAKRVKSTCLVHVQL